MELPRRFIELLTYEGDLVRDSFVGAATTAVAAARSRRRHVGPDTDPAYVDLAESRQATEARQGRPERSGCGCWGAVRVHQLVAVQTHHTAQRVSNDGGSVWTRQEMFDIGKLN